MPRSLYTPRIVQVVGCGYDTAAEIEIAMRWEVGGGNPGTLDHLSADEFDALARAVFAEGL